MFQQHTVTAETFLLVSFLSVWFIGNAFVMLQSGIFDVVPTVAVVETGVDRVLGSAEAASGVNGVITSGPAETAAGEKMELSNQANPWVLTVHQAILLVALGAMADWGLYTMCAYVNS